MKWISLVLFIVFSANFTVFAADRIVNVGVFDNQPIVFRDRNGDMSGLSIDVLKQVAEQQGWHLQFQHSSWKDALKALESGKTDLLVGIAYTEERDKRYDFSSQTLINNWGIVYQGQNQNLISLEELKGRRIALMAKSIHSKVFKSIMDKFDFEFTEVPAKDYAGALELVHSGDADAGVVNRVFGIMKGANYDIKETTIIFNPVQVRYATLQNQNPDLLSAIDEYLTEAKSHPSSDYYKFVQKWLASERSAALYTGIKWLILAIFSGLLIALIYSYSVRRQVNKRTGELYESNERFRQLAETVKQIFWIGTPDWKEILYISPAFEQIWGRSCESLYESPDSWLENVHQDDRDTVSAAVKLKASGDLSDPRFPRFRIVRPDGEIRWIMSQAYPIYNESGSVYRIAGIAEDITDQIRAQEALEQSEQRYRMVVENQSDFIVRWKPGGIRTFVNESYCRYFEQSREKLIGTSFFPLVSEESLAKVHNKIENITVENPVAHEEHRVKAPNGEIRWHQWIDRGLFNENGEITEYLSVGRDVTERKKAELELQVYKHIVAASKDMMSFVDTTYCYRAVNDAYLKAFNKKWDDLVGHSVEDVLGTTFFEAGVKQKLEACLAGETIAYQAWIDLPVKGKRYLDISYHPHQDEKGDITGVVVDIHDLTDRELAEQALHASESRLTNQQAALMELVAAQSEQEPDLHAVAGLATEIAAKTLDVERVGIWLLHKNPLQLECVDIYAAVENRHCVEESLYAEDYEDYFSTLLEEQATIVDDVSRSPEIQKHLGIYIKKSNIKAFMEALICLPGRIVGVIRAEQIGACKTWHLDEQNFLHSLADFISLTVEISEHKNTALELSRHREQLEELVEDRTSELKTLNKELESFSYSVSHDLRAPLRAINGFSQVLMEDFGDKLGDDGKQYLQRICTATERMGLLIDDLLQLSRVSRRELSYSNVDMTEIAHKIVENLKHLHRDRETNIVIEEGLMAHGDAGLLEIMLENLFSNAWKYSAKKDNVEIRFARQTVNGLDTFYISDKGAGFDMRYVDKLFAPFQRLHSAAQFEGTGIGLATVHRILSRHGGSVWTDSEVGKGSTFYFSFEKSPADRFQNQE